MLILSTRVLAVYRVGSRKEVRALRSAIALLLINTRATISSKSSPFLSSRTMHRLISLLCLGAQHFLELSPNSSGSSWKNSHFIFHQSSNSDLKSWPSHKNPNQKESKATIIRFQRDVENDEWEESSRWKQLCRLLRPVSKIWSYADGHSDRRRRRQYLENRLSR